MWDMIIKGVIALASIVVPLLFHANNTATAAHQTTVQSSNRMQLILALWATASDALSKLGTPLAAIDWVNAMLGHVNALLAASGAPTLSPTELQALRDLGAMVLPKPPVK